MRVLVLALAIACGHAASRHATTAGPVGNAAPTGPSQAAPTCVRAESGFSQARIVSGAIVACYLVPREGGDADDCWRFDLSARAWSFATRQPHADRSAVRHVTATATQASVCKPDGSDCVIVPLSGISVGPDDRIASATNSDRSIVAVWTSTGPVRVFDAKGKPLATIKPWPTGMTGNDPSVFRSAHVLGTVLEVRIADTPISSAIRLYDARSGKKIGDVLGGKPMDDEVDPVELGGTDYAFMTVDDRSILVIDVATGKQLARYRLGDVTLSSALISRVNDELVGVVATTAFVVDAAGKVSTVPLPVCPTC